MRSLIKRKEEFLRSAGNALRLTASRNSAAISFTFCGNKSERTHADLFDVLPPLPKPRPPNAAIWILFINDDMGMLQSGANQ